MEQAFSRTSRRTGWSEAENQLLWETAEEAQQQGLPLKVVFERIAEQTGRRPNSIRNYYYAQVREHGGENQHPARFVPFTQQEVDWLIEQVLIARAAGQSVRSCLQKLSGGDHSLMLRYQNKYRAVIKSRPDYVRELVSRLNEQGVACDAPTVHHRSRADVGLSCDRLELEARRSGDADLARACDTLADYLRGLRTPAASPALTQAANNLITPLKEFIARPDRAAHADEFCTEIAARIGALEAELTEGEATLKER